MGRSARNLAAALVAAAAAGACAAEPAPGPRGPAAVPFGQAPRALPAGVIRPGGAAPALLATVASFYDRWKGRYVRPACGGHVVATLGNAGPEGTLTVSEAQGYGMLAAAFLAGHDGGAREIFDGLVRVARGAPSRIDGRLMAWSLDARCLRTGDVSATDADLDMAYALLLADRQWGSAGEHDYRALAAGMVDAIQRHGFDPDTRLPRLGDWATGPPYQHTTRLSDLAVDHFRALGALPGGGPLGGAVDAAYALLARVQEEHAPASGLFPDFVVDAGAGPRPAPPSFFEGPHDGHYWFNACRIPWRIGTDLVVSGDPRARQILTRMTVWARAATGGDPGRIVQGYDLEGGTIGTTGGAAFLAPLGVAAMAVPDAQAWLDGIWADLARRPLESYYADSLRLLSLLVLSGAWWSPASGIGGGIGGG